MVPLAQLFGLKPWEIGCSGCRPNQLCNRHFWMFADAADQARSEGGDGG